MNKKPRHKFSHLDTSGHVRMVDVGAKPQTERYARASAQVLLKPATIRALRSLKKGDAIAAARVAGIMAAKKTAALIPLAHPIPITHCAVDISTSSRGVDISATVRTKSETGVEMEALTAVSVAALTIYDMIKSVERGAVITNIRLEEKYGGKSGHYKRQG